MDGPSHGAFFTTCYKRIQPRGEHDTCNERCYETSLCRRRLLLHIAPSADRLLATLSLFDDDVGGRNDSYADSLEVMERQVALIRTSLTAFGVAIQPPAESTLFKHGMPSSLVWSSTTARYAVLTLVKPGVALLLEALDSANEPAVMTGFAALQLGIDMLSRLSEMDLETCVFRTKQQKSDFLRTEAREVQDWINLVRAASKRKPA